MNQIDKTFWPASLAHLALPCTHMLDERVVDREEAPGGGISIHSEFHSFSRGWVFDHEGFEANCLGNVHRVPHLLKSRVPVPDGSTAPSYLPYQASHIRIGMMTYFCWYSGLKVSGVMTAAEAPSLRPNLTSPSAPIVFRKSTI